MNISKYLTEVLRDWRGSRNDFQNNRIENANWPIPFFGNPAKALVATVGVNPSSTEFKFSRGWADVKTDSDWKRRLRDYFNHKTPPHDWFKPWRMGLESLDMSYEKGTAAHFDVSYRATTAMIENKTTDRREFGQMVERDVAWLFRLLPLCDNLRLLLVFGPIIRLDGSTGNLARFLIQHARHHGFTTLPSGDLIHNETGKVFFVHEADTRKAGSVTRRIVMNIFAHRDGLRRRLEPGRCG